MTRPQLGMEIASAMMAKDLIPSGPILCAWWFEVARIPVNNDRYAVVVGADVIIHSIEIDRLGGGQHFQFIITANLADIDLGVDACWQLLGDQPFDVGLPLLRPGLHPLPFVLAAGVFELL